MPKIKLIFGSVLKPVDDPRTFEKLAVSLVQTNKYEINIIGFRGKNNSTHPYIRFYPVFNFKRLSFARATASWKFYKILLKVKPEVIIINTYELQLVSCLYKILFGSKLLYDVQENYYRNILYNSDLPKLLKYPLAILSRTIERLCHPMIDHYLLAEAGYAWEMPFIRRKFTIIENKSIIPPIKSHPINKESPLLLYSGTIAEAYGIFEAINFAVELHRMLPGLRFNITGFCPSSITLSKIYELIENQDFIELIGGDYPVSFETIKEAIYSADFGLLSYRMLPSIINSVPTRLFDYAAAGLPMFIPPHSGWINYCNTFKGAIPVNFHQFDAREVILQMKNSTFYPDGPPKKVLWETESPRLTHLFQQICS
jgi:hypothetical protein